MHSGTKYLDGQGRVIAGALCGREALVNEKFVPVMRSAGMSLSPFNAWVVLKGLETLSIRMHAQSERALALARWLEAQPQVERVYHPSLQSHPQHALAMAPAVGAGRRGGVLHRARRDAERARANAFTVIDATRICSITANLGDTKTTITHPSQHLARPPDRGAAPGRRHHAGHDPPGRRAWRTSTTSRPTCSAGCRTL